MPRKQGLASLSRMSMESLGTMEDRASKIFDCFDGNDDGKVTPEEIAAFLSALLWLRMDVPEHKSFYDHVVDIARETLNRKPGSRARRHLRPGDMEDFLTRVNESDEMWFLLAKTELLTNTMLLKQFLTMEYSEPVFLFSWREFIKAYIAINLLPITFTMSFYMHYRKSRTIAIVQQLFVQRALYLGRHVVPFVHKAIGDKVVHIVVPLAVALYTCCFLCSLLWWGYHGAEMVRNVRNTADFVVFQDPKKEVCFFDAHLPLLVTQMIVTGAAAKVAIKDGERIDKVATAVRDLGDHTQMLHADVRHTCPPDWSIAKLLAELQSKVDAVAHASVAMWIMHASMISVPALMIGLHRVMRLVTIGNFWASEAIGPPVAFMSMFVIFVGLLLWWQEITEIMRFLFNQRVRSNLYSSLFSRGQARSNELPCLKNRKPRNLIIWANMRFYVQLPNVLELRWIECLLLAVLVLALATCACFFVTLFQGTLLAGGNNEDLQVAILFVAAAFMFIIIFTMVMIFTAVSTGNIYRTDLYTLNRELWLVECEMTRHGKDVQWSKNIAYEPLDLKAQLQTAGASAGGDRVEEITGMGAADSKPDDLQAPLATLSVGSVRSSGQLVEENSYKELSTWRGLLEKLIGLLDRSNEYIEVFGIPIGTTFRNAIFSLAFTGIAAGMSSLISFVVKGRNDNGG